MPIYCYECEVCGSVSEEFRPRPGAPEKVLCRQCGRPAGRSYAAESSGASRGPAGGGRHAACKEIRSVAAGVMPEQAASAERALEARGVEGVRFDRRTGDAIFRDRPSRLRALKAMGLHDKDEIRG